MDLSKGDYLAGLIGTIPNFRHIILEIMEAILAFQGRRNSIKRSTAQPSKP